MDLMSCFSAPTMTPGLQNVPVRSWWKNMAIAVAIMTSQVDSSLLDYLSANGLASVVLDSGTIGQNRSSLRLGYEKGAVEAVRCLFNLATASLP